MKRLVVGDRMVELKACPFCGSSPVVDELEEDDEVLYQVVCPNCGCASALCLTTDELERHWNGRV